MKEENIYTIAGAASGLVYIIVSHYHIIPAFLIIIIGALLGKGKWRAEVKKEKEFKELINKNESERID